MRGEAGSESDMKRRCARPGTKERGVRFSISGKRSLPMPRQFFPYLFPCCLRPSGAAMLGMFILASAWMFLLVPATQAGQAHARFSASLRIDPALVEKDLGQIDGNADQERTRRPAPRRSDVLPRADGSGLCRKVFITRTRFRWRCS